MSGIFWGILHGWSLATPWDGQAVWWLQLLAMAWLFGRLCASTQPKTTLLPLSLFSLAWFTSSIWWLYTSMHDYGGLAAPLAALAVLALCALLASFYVAAGFVYLKLKTDSLHLGQSNYNALFNALLLAALWLLAEMLRGTVLSGFPWGAIGYAHINSPLAALAPYIGVYGISFVAAFVVALCLMTRSCLLKIALISILFIRAAMLPQMPPPAISVLPASGSKASELSVRLLQGNIAQNEKFEPSTGAQLALTWYSQALTQAVADGVDLVVTPETAIPYLASQLPADYWPALRRVFEGQTKTAALVGLPHSHAQHQYSNTAMGILPGVNAAPYRYDKHHLVPFGEYVPPLFRWFLDLMRIPLGDFVRGDLAQPSMLHKGWRLAPNICYEDLFGEELAARFADPSTAPTLFVNISNMGWFAKPNASSIAIDQHLHIAKMRTLEFDRPMVRATNTGATVIINRHGQVTHSLQPGTRGVLNGTVELAPATLTPYAKWASQYGLQPLWIWACSFVLLAILKRKYSP